MECGGLNSLSATTFPSEDADDISSTGIHVASGLTSTSELRFDAPRRAESYYPRIKLTSVQTASRMGLAKLPIELVEMMLDQVVPPDGSLALPASDITARTLHSCLTVCKATFNRSLELLYTRCLYIDSGWRLRSLLRTYSTDSLRLDLKLAASTSMYLEPFSANTIEEPQVVEDLHSLFQVLGNYIRRMVVDMPLRSAYPDRRSGREVRVPLRNAFRKLIAMEEFVSVRDELYLSTIFRAPNDVESPVWARWPNLRRLALYNVDISSEDIVKNIGRLRCLQTLVLIRPDGMEGFRSLQESLSSATAIKNVDVFEMLCDPIQGEWVTDGKEISTRPRAYECLMPSSDMGDTACAKAIWIEFDQRSKDIQNEIEVCQDWVREHALNGRLWA